MTVHVMAAAELGAPHRYSPEVVARFWAKVEKTDTCWLWTASKCWGGYGKFWDGDVKKLAHAHRYAYELLVGPIPQSLQIDHLCRVRGCVNPDHLEPVPQRENLLRGETIVAANKAKTHCLRGHEFTPANTIVSVRRGHKWRNCRECKRIRARGDRGAAA